MATDFEALAPFLRVRGVYDVIGSITPF